VVFIFYFSVGKSEYLLDSNFSQKPYLVGSLINTFFDFLNCSVKLSKHCEKAVKYFTNSFLPVVRFYNQYEFSTKHSILQMLKIVGHGFLS